MKLSLKETRNRMEEDKRYALLHLMEFVDDFMRRKDPAMITEIFPQRDERLDALAAATAESLCTELGLEAPLWLTRVPACQTPWFVSGIENLKAIALVESPLPFRIRKIFVLKNFLTRV
jgi:hypothetical protein